MKKSTKEIIYKGIKLGVVVIGETILQATTGSVVYQQMQKNGRSKTTSAVSAIIAAYGVGYVFDQAISHDLDNTINQYVNQQVSSEEEKSKFEGCGVKAPEEKAPDFTTMPDAVAAKDDEEDDEKDDGDDPGEVPPRHW